MKIHLFLNGFPPVFLPLYSGMMKGMNESLGVSDCHFLLLFFNSFTSNYNKPNNNSSNSKIKQYIAKSQQNRVIYSEFKPLKSTGMICSE